MPCEYRATALGARSVLNDGFTHGFFLSNSVPKLKNNFNGLAALEYVKKQCSQIS